MDIATCVLGHQDNIIVCIEVYPPPFVLDSVKRYLLDESEFDGGSCALGVLEDVLKTLKGQNPDALAVGVRCRHTMSDCEHCLGAQVFLPVRFA